MAKLNVAGGNIRNIMAASLNPPHILASARAEYMKLEHPITDAELKALS